MLANTNDLSARTSFGEFVAHLPEQREESMHTGSTAIAIDRDSLKAENEKLATLLREAHSKWGGCLGEIERLRLENWQLKGALGYPVPGDIPQGAFKCGLCEARAIASHDEQDVSK